MAKSYLKDGKGISLIMSEEWDLLKIFADELLAFKEATEMFSYQRPLHHLILLLFLIFF